MNRLVAICDSPETAAIIKRQFDGAFETVHVPTAEISQAEPPGALSVVSVNLKDSAAIANLRAWLKLRPRNAKIIFITERNSRIEVAQAHALGATDIVHHTSEIGPLLMAVQSDFDTLAASFPLSEGEASLGIDAGVQALQGVLAAAMAGGPLDRAAIDSAGDTIVGQIHNDGLNAWINTVRKHHSQTYQHSLLVTGLAVGFGRHIGLGHQDLKRLSFASILHDVGKARVPISILEKPTALDREEMNIMKQHPSFGSEALASTPDLPPEMIDVVLHHHEYLDGSGYPHGLSGNEIPDLVRILTIADIFGALIEQRSYKAPMPGEAAYQILLNMGPKLDKDLMREFRHVARLKLKAA